MTTVITYTDPKLMKDMRLLQAEHWFNHSLKRSKYRQDDLYNMWYRLFEAYWEEI